MKIDRARIEIEYDGRVLVCYYFQDKEPIIEINGKEYQGVVKIKHIYNSFDVKVNITNGLNSL